jgi:YggT family protein
MFVLGIFLNAIAGVLNTVLSIYMIIVIVAALITWVNPDPYNPIVRFLFSMTEPVFRRVRRVIPFPTGGLDLSPLIVVLAIIFLQLFLVEMLRQVAVRLQ